MFQIEDEYHAELQAPKFASFEDALAELRRRAKLPWDEEPNLAPCTSWQNCGRYYVVIEYDSAALEVRQVKALEVSARGPRWLLERTANRNERRRNQQRSQT